MKNYRNYNEETIVFVQSTIIENLKTLIEWETTLYACDLHNEIFNTQDIFMYDIDAISFLDAFGTFKAIDKIVTYERDNFGNGETITNLSNPCSVANMLMYIIGEEFMYDSNVLRKYWDNNIGTKELTEILEEFQATINK